MSKPCSGRSVSALSAWDRNGRQRWRDHDFGQTQGDSRHVQDCPDGALAGLIAVALPASVRAQEASAGSWIISKSEPAPWADAAQRSEAEARALLGKQVDILPKRIDGPKQLGFKGASIKTLETGCANEIDFHMVDADTALFGLNDRIYTLTRRK